MTSGRRGPLGGEKVPNHKGETFLEGHDESLALRELGRFGSFALEPAELCDMAPQVGEKALEGSLVGHEPASNAGSNAGRKAGPGSGSIATLGSRRSSHRGNAQVVRPSS